MEKKNTVLSNLFWRFFERCGAQGVKLLVEIVLARILLPDDYGLIALVTVFITFFNVFVDSGLGNALVQKKNADELDFSSVFWFNCLWCIVLYFILFFLAPYISLFYDKPELTAIIRVLGIQIIISGVKSIEEAYIARTMQFKKFFFATLGGTIGAACIGIYMAYRGYGVWALVCQHLFNTLVDTIILWLSIKWRPKLFFSWIRFKGLFSYGWKLLLSSVIETSYNQIRQLIIGKVYSAESLAFYNRGEQFPHLFVTNVNNAIDSVLLPTMSKVQDDKERIKGMTRKAIKTSTFIMAPLMIGLVFIGEPFVRLLLTEKWLPCVLFMRVFCITYMFFPIHTANLNAIKALGRSDIFLKLEIVKKAIGMITLIISMSISVEAMAYSLLVVSILSQIINSWPNRKLLNYSYLDQMKDIMPSLLLAVAMGICIYFLVYLGLKDIYTIILQIFSGFIIYCIGARLLRLDVYFEILEMIKGVLKKRDFKTQ